MGSQPFRTEDYLDSEEAIAAYLDAALEDGDERVLLMALRHVANNTGGMKQLAEAADLNRESLYRALSRTGNPRLTTLSALLHTYGLRLSVAPICAGNTNKKGE